MFATTKAVPVDKNGERPGAETHLTELVCYKAKAVPFTPAPVCLGDQLGSLTGELTRRDELCVPSAQGL